MGYDIYGNTLQRGHCEVHPHVHEEFPCSVCIAEKENHDKQQQEQRKDWTIAQQQERIADLEQQLADKDSTILMLYQCILDHTQSTWTDLNNIFDRDTLDAKLIEMGENIDKE